jgi:hypothetical protein
MSILTIWLLLSPHVPAHAHGSTRVLAHFFHDVPPVSSCILIHALHWSAGSSVELLPVHFVAPTLGHEAWAWLLLLWNLPLGHVAHEASPVAPPNLPPGQLMHDVLSVAGWYFPAGHLVHELLPVPLYLPTGHVEHVRPTVLLVYFPPGQLVHTWLLEYLPVGHTATHCAVVTDLKCS